MNPDLSPESEVKKEEEETNKQKEDCFYLNWELIEWMTEPCHPCMIPRSDSG